TDPRYEVAPLEEYVDVVEETVEAAPVVEDLELDLGEVDLGALLSGDDPDASPLREPPVSDHAEADPGPSPAPEAAPGRRLALSELDVAGVSWQLIEALQDALAAGDVAEVVADVDGLDAVSEVGASYRELIA